MMIPRSGSGRGAGARFRLLCDVREGFAFLFQEHERDGRGFRACPFSFVIPSVVEESAVELERARYILGLFGGMGMTTSSS